MAFFELSSDITIGKFRFSGVHEVQVKRSVHNITDTAIIKIPYKGRLTKNKQTAEEVITGKQFKDGDPVVIKLGYNGDLKTEFMGFVTRRNLNTPLEIECEGYSWLLKRKKTEGFKTKVAVKDLLDNTVSGLENGNKISVVCNADISLINADANNKNAYDMVNYVAGITDGCLASFFVKPDTLWCGLLYTSCARGENGLGSQTVLYKLGYNTLKDNGLKERIADREKVKVTYNKTMENGNKISQSSDVFDATVHTYNRILNQVNSIRALKMLADEKAYQLCYSGFEGKLSAFLQPFVSPGDIAVIDNPHDSDQNGSYLIESTEVTFGPKGARRIIELGPRIGFAKEKHE